MGDRCNAFTFRRSYLLRYASSEISDSVCDSGFLSFRNYMEAQKIKKTKHQHEISTKFVTLFICIWSGSNADTGVSCFGCNITRAVSSLPSVVGRSYLAPAAAGVMCIK